MIALPGNAVGSIILVIGVVIGLAGEIRLLVFARRRSLAWFLGCLLVPLAAWLFLALNVREAWKPVAVATVGVIVAGFGYWAGGF